MRGGFGSHQPYIKGNITLVRIQIWLMQCMRKGSKTYHWNIKESNNQPDQKWIWHTQGIQLCGFAITEQSPVDNITGFIHNAQKDEVCAWVFFLLRAGVCIFRPPKALRWKRGCCVLENGNNLPFITTYISLYHKLLTRKVLYWHFWKNR